MYYSNPKPELDFVSGLRDSEIQGNSYSWLQRLTDSYGLIITLSGEGSISYGTGTLLLKERELILTRPGLKHRFWMLKNWSYIWFHFIPRKHITYALDWKEQIPGVGKVSFSQEEFEIVQSALREAHLLEYKHPVGWNSLAYLLLESVIVRGYNRLLTKELNTDPQIRTAQELLTGSHDSIDRIAVRCGISRASLYAKFKTKIGISPRQYRENAMLRHAAHLLETTTLSIAEIAEQIGISDPYYFSIRFHKFSGFAPREYRKIKLQS